MNAINFKIIDKVNTPHVIAFICSILTDYDTNQLERLKTDKV